MFRIKMLLPSLGLNCIISEKLHSLQSAYIAQPIPHATHFNTKEEGSVHLRIVAIHLQDHALLQL
jgi:hypothetical protein